MQWAVLSGSTVQMPPVLRQSWQNLPPGPPNPTHWPFLHVMPSPQVWPLHSMTPPAAVRKGPAPAADARARERDAALVFRADLAATARAGARDPVAATVADRAAAVRSAELRLRRGRAVDVTET